MNIVPNISRLTDKYKLTDKYRSFIFLLLPILAASSDTEPPKQAEYTRMYTYQQDIQFHDNRKQNNMFDNSRQLFDNSRQFQIQMKLKLRHCVVAAIVAA
jgi:hypothetical protein